MGIDDISDAKRYNKRRLGWVLINSLLTNTQVGWNYGHSPRYEYNRNARFACGTIDISLSVTQNRISGCVFLAISLDKAIFMMLKHI